MTTAFPIAHVSPNELPQSDDVEITLDVRLVRVSPHSITERYFALAQHEFKTLGDVLLAVLDLLSPFASCLLPFFDSENIIRILWAVRFYDVR
jgi:hypothetical protein